MYVCALFKWQEYTPCIIIYIYIDIHSMSEIFMLCRQNVRTSTWTHIYVGVYIVYEYKFVMKIFFHFVIVFPTCNSCYCNFFFSLSLLGYTSTQFFLQLIFRFVFVLFVFILLLLSLLYLLSSMWKVMLKNSYMGYMAPFAWLYT